MSETDKKENESNEECTALRREVAALRDTEKRAKILIDNLPVGVYRRTCGADGRVVMANRAFLRILGYATIKEIKDIPIAQVYCNPSECHDFSRNVLLHGEKHEEYLKWKRKDGETIWVAITAKLVCDANDKPAFFDAVIEDITQKKQLEEEAEIRQHQLAQADKMISLGILVSGVAHEINNPNQFIVSHISPLKRAWEDALPILNHYYEDHGDFMMGGRRFSVRRDQIPDMFAGILDGSQRIKHIVDELRDYAREHPVAVTEAMDLNNIVKSALSLLSNLIKKSTQKFLVTYGPNLPLVIGDYQRIEQVLINLIQNSCQALPNMDSAVHVRTYLNPSENAIVTEVIDSGGGISPENITRITDPFFTTKRSSGGTGLGLSVSASIIKEHGGTLVFESTLGTGTTARMSLPVRKGKCAYVPEANQQRTSHL